MRIGVSVLVLVVLAVGGCRPKDTDVKPGNQTAVQPGNNQAVVQPPAAEPLALESKSLTVTAGTDHWVNVSKGKFKSIEPGPEFLAVVPDGSNRLKISVGKDAGSGDYLVNVQGETGSPVGLMVQVRDGLALEPPAVAVEPGTDQSVTVSKGKLQGTPQAKETFLSVVLDGPNRIKISADPKAPGGVYHVAVKAELGPDFDLKVQVPKVSVRRFVFEMEQSKIHFTEGKEESEVVTVAEGWATGVPDVKTNEGKAVEGLTAVVEDNPIHVFTTNPGSGYKKDEVLFVAGGQQTQLRITSVLGNGGVENAAILAAGDYYPANRTVDLYVAGGSGTDATFNLTNSVKIVAGKNLKAGKYKVSIKGQGQGGAFIEVIVDAPKTSAVPGVAPPESDASREVRYSEPRGFAKARILANAATDEGCTTRFRFVWVALATC